MTGAIEAPFLSISPNLLVLIAAFVVIDLAIHIKFVFVVRRGVRAHLRVGTSVIATTSMRSSSLTWLAFVRQLASS